MFFQWFICFAEHSWAVFNPKISFVIKATKWPASGDSARAIVSDAIRLLVTLSNFFNFHEIATALLLPHRSTIWAPWDAPLGKLAWIIFSYTITLFASSKFSTLGFFSWLLNLQLSNEASEWVWDVTQNYCPLTFLKLLILHLLVKLFLYLTQLVSNYLYSYFGQQKIPYPSVQHSIQSVNLSCWY